MKMNENLTKEQFISLLENMKFGEGYDIEIPISKDELWYTAIAKTRFIDSEVIIVGGTDGNEQIYGCGDWKTHEDYIIIVDSIFKKLTVKEMENIQIKISNKFSMSMTFKGIDLLTNKKKYDNIFMYK